MICASLGVAGLDAAAARKFVELLEPLPGRRARSFTAAGAVLGQMIQPGPVWQPGRSASGRLVVFNGQFHNRSAIAAELGLAATDNAQVYAAALDRWGHAADEHVIGHYCTISVDPGGAVLRCARSPIEAPPLHFRLHRGGAIAASLPRPLFWRDSEPRAVNLDRLARSLVVDFSDRYAGHYAACFRVPQGAAIELNGAGWREVWRYDLSARPRVRMRRPQDYVEAGLALLDEAVSRTLDGATRPGVLLSGGLDSSSVAASAMLGLGDRGNVFGFTYGPDDDWQAVSPAPGTYISEFPGVEQFAAMHPGLTVERFTNPGRDFRFRQRELLQAMDCGTPSVGLCWSHHAIHERARELGCDVLLSPNWGNETFSCNAPWAMPEWLATGRWRQLAAALHHEHADRRPLWRRLISRAVFPWLPAFVWRTVHRLWHGTPPDPLAASALSPALFDALRAGGTEPARNQFRSRRAFWARIMAEDGQDREQYSQGMEVLYGVPLRDPAAYRPLVEFCYGLPTEAFRRDGQDRWLAREMARGRLPEAQRLRRDTGMHHADWHARLAPIGPELADEIERLASDPDIAAMLDLPRMRRLVAELAALDPADHAARLPYVTALPIGIAAGRFVAWAKGRNDL